MESSLLSNVDLENTMQEKGQRKLKKLSLRLEVEALQGELVKEQALNRVLKTALQGPTNLAPSDSSIVPPEVLALLSELVTVEQEITSLEKQVRELKLNMYQETKQSRKWDLQQRRKELQYKGQSADDREQRPRSENQENTTKKGKKTRNIMGFSGPLFGFQLQSTPSSDIPEGEKNYCLLPRKNTR